MEVATVQKIWLILLGWLVVCLAFAQPGEYNFLLGERVPNGDMDVVDLKSLGRDREGLDEFLAVLVRFPNSAPNAPDPIYFVHFAYGGTPPTMHLRNIRTFRPLIPGATPPTPRFARLIYQPAVIRNDRTEPAYWYLIIWPGFVYALREDFYKAPADASVILWGKYYQRVDENGQVVGPAFADGTHLGEVRRLVGVTPVISSILITSASASTLLSSQLLAIDRNGNILGYWGHTLPQVFCEALPCCGFMREPRTRLAFLSYGGFSSVVGLTPTSAIDEYAAVLYVDWIGGETVYSMPFVVRFGVDGQVRWRKFYRLFRQDGTPLPNIAYSPFWIVEDRASPTSPPNRLVFCTGYEPSQVWRVDRETGSPIWGFFSSHTYEVVSALPNGNWLFAGEGEAQIMQMDDNGITFTGERAGNPGNWGPNCGDYGDRYFLGAVGTNYIVSADDSSRRIGDDCSQGFVFLPTFGFKKLGLENYNACHHLSPPPSFERGQVCAMDDRGFSLIPFRASSIDVRAEILEGRLPLGVECRVEGLPLCEGATHCENGVKWVEGDCGPYPNDPFNADLSAFGDCCVDDGDLLEVLLHYGTQYNYNDPTQFKPGRGDVDCNGEVNDDDLLIVLLNYGQGCSGGG